MADEVLVPTSTVSSSGFTAAGAATHHECTDEGCDNQNGDTDRIFSTVDLVGAACRLALSNPSAPPTASQEHTLRIVARRQGTAELGEPTLNVRLFSGVTQILATQITLNATWTLYERPLTAGEIAAIASYTDLEVLVTVNTLPTAGQSTRVTAIDLLIEEEETPPNPPSSMVPDGTVSNSGWTATGAASLHAATDDGFDPPNPNDATDYISASAVSSSCRMSLTSPVDPPSPAVKHFARVRARRTGTATSGEPTLNVRMVSGSTQFLAFQIPLASGATWATYEHELTPTEVSLLADYDAVDVVLIVDQLPTSGQGIDVSAVDLFISDESTVPPSADSIVPDETVSNTGWTAFGQPTLHECTDEGFEAPNPNDDVDRIVADTVGATCRLGFTAPIDTPSSSNVHTLRLRARRQGLGTNGEPTVNVRMVAGSTQFLAVQFQLTGGGTWTTYERELTAGEIAAIGGDYSDIDGLVICDAIPTSGDSIRVSAIELHMPEAPREPPEADRIFPDATVGNSGWTVVGAGSAHAALDDNPDDHDADATYATASVVGSLLTLGLSDPASSPTAALRVLRVVARREGTDLAGEPAILLKLLTAAGATEVIAFPATMTAGASYAVYQTILTGAQVALLPSDLADLRVSIELTANPTAGASVRVTCVDLAFLDSIPGSYVVADGGADLDYSEGTAPGYETRLNVFLPAIQPTKPKPIHCTIYCSGLKTTDRRYVITGAVGDGLAKLMLEEGWPHIEISVLHAASKVAPGSSTPIPGGGRFRDFRTQEWIDYWSSFRCVARAMQYIRKLCESGGILEGYGDPDQIYPDGRSGGGHMAMAAFGLRDFAGTPGMDSRPSKAQGGVINAVAFPWWPIAVQTNWSQLSVYFDGPGGPSASSGAAAMNEVPEDIQSLASFLRYAFDDTIGLMPGESGEGFIGNAAKTLAGALYLRATEPDESIPYDNGETAGAYTGDHASDQLVTWPHSIWNSRNIAIEIRQLQGDKVNTPGEPCKRGVWRVSTEASKFSPQYDSVSIEAGDFSETDPVVLDQRDFLVAQELAAVLTDLPVEYRILVNVQQALQEISVENGYFSDLAEEAVYLVGEPIPDSATYPCIGITPTGVTVDTEGETLQNATTAKLGIDLRAIVSGGADVVKRLHCLVSDIHTALQQDRTRGGDAIFTSISRWEEAYPVVETDDEGWVALEVVVHFRTEPMNLTASV